MAVLQRSSYFEFVTLHLHRLGIRVDSETYVLTVSEEKQELSLERCTEDTLCESPLVVELKQIDLAFASHNAVSVCPLVVRTGASGQIVYPQIEQLVLRTFQMPPFPEEDLEDLIYPALFGFDLPEIIWQSNSKSLRVLQYRNSVGQETTVSLGLSNRGREQPATDESALVRYELALKSNSQVVAREFSSWVKYVHDTGHDILIGEWLEFEGEKTIPSTNIAGFLVVPPDTIPASFPAGENNVSWHELIPVHRKELDAAKQIGVLQAAHLIRSRSRTSSA